VGFWNWGAAEERTRTDDSALRKIHRRIFFVLAFLLPALLLADCIPLFMADTEPVGKSSHTPNLRSNAMSHQYQAIAWNRQKRVYDIVLVAGVTLYLTLFIEVSAFLFPYATRQL